MRRTAYVSLLACVLTLIWTNAEAQHPHQGFWIGFGLGGGINTADGFEGGRAGAAGYLRMGGTVSPKVLLGGEAIGWGRTIDEVTIGAGNTSFIVQFYPGSNGGVFLKGGLGIATIRVSTDILGVDVQATETGFGTTLGLGYDARVGRSLFLTPNVDVIWQTYDIGGASADQAIVLFTLGLTWH